MGWLDWLRGRPPPERIDDWRIFSASNVETGQMAVFRMRITRPARADLDRLRTAVVLSWPYDSPDGLPWPELKIDMDELDRVLDPLSSGNELSELVHVATGLGKREWLFYVSNAARFRREVARLSGGGWDWALEITEMEDPGWERWQSLLGLLLETAERPVR